jgi:hypothetical protein
MMAVNALKVATGCEGDPQAGNLPSISVHHRIRHQMAACIAASIRILPMAFVDFPFGFESSHFDSHLPILHSFSRSRFLAMAGLTLRCALKAHLLSGSRRF